MRRRHQRLCAWSFWRCAARSRSALSSPSSSILASFRRCGDWPRSDRPSRCRPWLAARLLAGQRYSALAYPPRLRARRRARSRQSGRRRLPVARRKLAVQAPLHHPSLGLCTPFASSRSCRQRHPALTPPILHALALPGPTPILLSSAASGPTAAASPGPQLPSSPSPLGSARTVLRHRLLAFLPFRSTYRSLLRQRVPSLGIFAL